MHSTADLSENAAFQLRIRQAVLSAQHSTKQAGLLMIDFDRRENLAPHEANFFPAFMDESWSRLNSALRNSDAIYRMTGGETAVLRVKLK